MELFFFLLKDELLDFMQAGIDELTEKVKELGEKAKYFDAIYDKALKISDCQLLCHPLKAGQ